MLVVNGGYGLVVYGLSSSEPMRNSALRRLSASCASVVLAQQQQRGVFQFAGGRVEVACGGHAAILVAGKHGIEGPPLGRGKCAQQVPIRGGHECHALAFALDNQPHGNALHASSRESRTHLAPQQGRHLVAEKPIDDPARFLGSNQRVVDIARVFQGLADGLFRDFVKHQPVHGNVGLQQLAQMPANGLPFAVFVRRQIQLGGLLEQRFELANLLGFARRDDVNGAEAVVHVDAQVGPFFLLVLGRNLLGTLRQVAHMANAGLDHVVAAQEFADRAGLGRRFNNYQGLATRRRGLAARSLFSFCHTPVAVRGQRQLNAAATIYRP